MKHASFLSLTSLALLVFATFAAAAPCTTAAPACTEMVGIAGSAGRTLVYRSYPLETRNPAITRGVIMVHGLGRDADKRKGVPTPFPKRGS